MNISLLAALVDNPILEELSQNQIDVIDTLSQSTTVFDKWFMESPDKIDDERIKIDLPSTSPDQYIIDLRGESDAIGIDNPMEDLILILQQAQYDTLNWELGYITRKNRTLRLGAVLKTAIGQLTKLRSGEVIPSEYLGPIAKLSAYKPKHIAFYISRLTDILDAFVRRDKTITDSLSVIITKNRYDIARMSEGRSWTSCTDINKTTHAYYEVMCGGFVAYLVDPDNILIHPKQGIIKAKMRVGIRKVITIKDGQVVNIRAIPENKTYPTEPKQLSELLINTVTRWISDRQPDNIIDKHDIIAGYDYSDSYDQHIHVDRFGPFEIDTKVQIQGTIRSGESVSNFKIHVINPDPDNIARQVSHRLPPIKLGVPTSMVYHHRKGTQSPLERLKFIKIGHDGHVKTDGSDLSDKIYELWLRNS